jgi:hypothetical protein
MADESDQFFCGNAAGHVTAGKEAVSQISFAAVQLKNFFFDGIGGDQAINSYRSCLAYAVSPV